VAGWSMAQLDINLTSFDVFWTNLLQGLGFGLAYTPMTVLAFATLAPDRVTEGTAIFHMLRNFGSSLFISVTIVVWSESRAMSYANLREHASPTNETLSYADLAGAWSIGDASGLTALSNEILRQAAMIGYINAFYLFAIAAGIAAPFVLLLRNPE
jgi:DHA2 family multidrug resistance protein